MKIAPRVDKDDVKNLAHRTAVDWAERTGITDSQVKGLAGLIQELLETQMNRALEAGVKYARHCPIIEI